MLNKRFPVTIFILALTFSLVKSQNNQPDSTSTVTCPSNVSSPLDCWFQSECLPCMVNDQQIQCVPFTTFGPNGEVLNGRDACKRINPTYGSYVPKMQDSLWGGLGLVVHKLIDRRELKLTSDDRLNISRTSLAYYENVTQSLQTVRDLYNISSIVNMQSLVALTSNLTATLQSTINKTLTTLKNEWSLYAAQFQSFINASQYEILEMWNIRKEAQNCSLTNTTNSDLLVRDYFSLSSVFYCHSTQRLQQFVTLLDQFSSLVENIQVVTLLNTYNQIGLLYERRYLCENSSTSIPLANISTSNDTNSNNNNVNNNINDNGYGNNNYYGNGYGNNNDNSNDNSTTNNDTSSNSTSNNDTSNYNTSSCTWNNTLGYQMINAEHVKQSVAWYYLWEIEELRAFIDTFTSKLSVLVAKKCEEETYIGEYLDNVTLQNSSCVNQTNFLSNTTLFNDTMDVLLDWMDEVDEVNATYVNQNDTEATNATLLFTVKRKINWDTQDLNNVSSEFCSSLIPYLNAFMGTEYDATWCEPSLAFIVNKPCSEVSSSNASSSNSTSSNTTSSNVTSSNTTSSNETSCDEIVSSSNETTSNTSSTNESSSNVTSSNVTSTNTTSSNETSCDEEVSSSNESSANVSSSNVSSSNVSSSTTSNTTTNETITSTENTTVTAPVGSTNEMNGTDCDNANVTSSNDTVQNGSSTAVNNTSSNTTSTSYSHKYSEIIFSIPVYLFPCNSTKSSTNETIPSTNETVPSSNCTNTTIPATNETIPLSNSTDVTVPVPSSANTPVPVSIVAGGSTNTTTSNETIPAPNENENVDCPETAPSSGNGANNGNSGTNTVTQFP